MILQKSLSWIDFSMIFLFGIIYLTYITRTFRLAKKFGTNARNILFKLILRSAYFALIIIAVLGPSFGEIKKEVKAVGKDIYIAVDLSLSMNATDVPPSRLSKIKYELGNIISKLKSDRIGLIIFSSEAFMQCPLTYDQNALTLFIETFNSSLVPFGGTDLYAPLKMALNKHEDPDNTTTSKQAKVIVLVSDGEDFGGEIEDVAEEINKAGIKVFALGVGTESGGKIPYANGFKTDNNGQVVVSQLNSQSMKKIASMTDGQYYELNDRVNQVEKMTNAIAEIEGELRDTRQVDASANKYYFFLLGGLILIAIDVLFKTRTFSI